MKRSGYRTSLHIYFIFLLSLLCILITASVLFFMLITVRKADGTIVRSDWPESFTQEFEKQIVFIDGKPRVTQAGLELLQKEEMGIQILDAAGEEQFGFRKPEQVPSGYSSAGLLEVERAGHLADRKTASLIGVAADSNCTYIVHFPTAVNRLTMQLNGEHFIRGRTIAFWLGGLMLLLIFLSGIVYGFCMTRTMGRVTDAVKAIALRAYMPVQGKGTFSDIYDSLNVLDAEIRSSDRLREQTDTMRREWIANITHDLKTPLSPVKGYAEIMQEEGGSGAKEQYRRYAEIILKNVSYMEQLLDDLKLTYQLESGTVPLERKRMDLVRFLKETVIDILNTPEYEDRSIQIQSSREDIFFSFDRTLFRRAFNNLIVNALIHGGRDAQITVGAAVFKNEIQVTVSDNGKGMTAEEADRMFRRYYRGTDTDKKPEGTGLGLAITKNIIESHGGAVDVHSAPDEGTEISITFKVN